MGGWEQRMRGMFRRMLVAESFFKALLGGIEVWHWHHSWVKELRHVWHLRHLRWQETWLLAHAGHGCLKFLSLLLQFVA